MPQHPPTDQADATTRRLLLTPLSPDAFAPFGTISALPPPGERVVVGPPDNLRPAVPSRLVLTHTLPSALPLAITTMERHRFSSQSFVPSAPVRWLVLVAPHAAAGGPDMTRALAFLADGTQAITYRPDTWHHPLTTIAAGAVFATLTFLDGSADDEEFVPVAHGITVTP